MPTAEDVAVHYRERCMAAVVFTVAAESVTGRSSVSNEEIAEVAAANPDVLIPFASVDPNGAQAVAEARRLIRDYEAVSVALHKQQVHIDLSGWSPKYFPPQLIQYANSLLKDRVLFGSGYPMITPDRWLADFEQADFKDEVRPLVLKRNAARLLGL